jgi:gliding motility-associated-like protein
LSNQSYSVTITDANQCTYTQNIAVLRNIPPSLILVSQTNETCSNSNGQILVVVSDGRSPYSYSWSNNLTNNNPTNSGLSAGTYSVTVTDADGCVDSLSVVIGNHEGPVGHVASVSPAHCDLPDGSARLEVSGGSGNYTYNWGTMPPRTGIFETQLTGGQYIVTVSDGICEVEVIVDVPNLPGPTVNASANPSEAFVSQATIRFNDGSTNATSWYWDFSTGQYSNEQKPSFKYEVPGTYYVVITVTDDYGCTASDTITVIIHEGLEVWIPDAFSPNGDGLNDYFGPVGRGMSLDGYEMVIYDRWGKQAFLSTDYYHRWDGTINGQKVEMNAVFVYRIIIYDLLGKEYRFTGRVTLVYSTE